MCGPVATFAARGLGNTAPSCMTRIELLNNLSQANVFSAFYGQMNSSKTSLVFVNLGIKLLMQFYSGWLYVTKRELRAFL